MLTLIILLQHKQYLKDSWSYAQSKYYFQQKNKIKNRIQQLPNRVSYQIWPMAIFFEKLWKFMDILVIINLAKKGLI